jgi:mRNA interferase RelE/StbE
MKPGSSPYEVMFTDTALKSLRRYPRADQQRILQRIEQLAMEPKSAPNVKRLVEHDVAYRLRVGNYRVLFDRDDTIRVIDVIDVLPRGQAYGRK